MTDIALQQPNPEIPDKLYFKIGEVSELLGVEPYVLRYWETEFAVLSPKKSGTGHRLYRRKDVEMVLEIKRLLYEQRFTIEGARKFLETRAKPEVVPAPAAPGKRKRVQRDLFDADPAEVAPLLGKIREELKAIAKMLK